MKVYVLDNYDSFTYNLVHCLEGEGAEVQVERNDQVNFSTIDNCDKLVLSPGPGLPNESGMMSEVISKYAGVKPILGICLGNQAIATHYGMKLMNLDEVFHGVEHMVLRTGYHYLFRQLPASFSVGRYHSWIVTHQVDSPLEVLATDEEGRIMALAHPIDDVCGLQFHPESIMTRNGRQIIRNWIRHPF